MRSLSRFAPTLATTLLLGPLLAPAPAAAGGWIALGPRAGQPVDSLAVVPDTPSRVFVSGRSSIFRSSRAAASWDRQSGEHGLPAHAVGTLHASRVPDGPIYLVSDGTLYRGDDPGAESGPHWTAVRDRVLSVAVAPTEPSRLYADVANDDGSETRLEVSRDGGETWLPTGELPSIEAQVMRSITQVHVSASDPDTLYFFLILIADHGFPSSGLLLRSTDAGATWQTQHDLARPEPELFSVYAPAIDPRDPAVIYLATDAGVYRSADGGTTLELVSDELPSYRSGHRVSPFTDFVIDPQRPETLYATFEAEKSAPGGVYRSDDGGVDWQAVSDGLPLPLTVEEIAIDDAHPDTLFVTTPLGVYRSIDRGDHWSSISAGLPTPVAAVALDPEHPTTIFAGADHHRLFASHDGGGTWHRSDEGIPPSTSDYIRIPDPIYYIDVAPSDPSILFANGELEVDGQPVGARSLDGGESWELISGPPYGGLTALSIDPRDPKRLVATVGTGGGGAFVSDTLGTSWHQTFGRRAYSLTRAPSDPDVLYLGAVSFGPGPEGACRSGDAGETWSCSDAVLSEGGAVQEIVVDPRDASVVLAALNASGDVTLVRRSFDGGLTWSPGIRPFPGDPLVHELAADPSQPSVVWAATGDGAWRSPDWGETWERMSDGLPREVSDLTFDPSGRVLLVATPEGAFRFSTSSGPPPPPEIPWTTDPALSGFRVKVRIGQGERPPIGGTKEPACIPETVCFSGALPGRSEVFVRIVGPKPNGHLWPTLVKFTTSRVEVWIEQLSTGAIRHYELRGATPGEGELPGLFDRDGFLPD